MTDYTEKERNTLKQLAYDAIKAGLDKKELSIDTSDKPKKLLENRACFVTIEISRRLRGCIGTLQAYRPLIIDIVANAQAAAFKDPRFEPLSSEEFKKITLQVSVLSNPEPLQFSSEEDLLTKIQPKIDGLIITDLNHRGTFLPSVWDQLPNKVDFWQHLKLKAGLPPDYWSNSIKVQRYTTESF